jgi:hypothetical protein
MKGLINVLVLLATVFLCFRPVQARADYDPTIQRWIEMDPIGELGGINLYGFNYNNALSFIDSFGWDPAFSPGISMFSRLTPSQQVNASRAAAPATIAIVAGTATGGAADTLLVGGGFLNGGSLLSYMTVGALSSLGGDTGYQGTKMALGDQQGFDFGELGLNGLIGTGFGFGGYALGAAADSLFPLLKIKCPSKVPVSRWGSPLKPGEFVMQGPKSPLNYLLSGKYQPSGFPTFGQPPNVPASYMSGVTYNVPPSSLSWPSGRDLWKGLLGQRIYNP